MRSLCSDYRSPRLGLNRVVECFEGYSAYLIIVDKALRYVWVFLRKLKEPPVDLVLAFLAIHSSPVVGVIHTDQGGELTRSANFRTEMFTSKRYVVEPTGADSPAQNGSAEKCNHTLAVTTRSLLYGAGLPARFWSAALLHAAYIHNCCVHTTTKITPYKGWFGRRPDLKHMRVFRS
jgi:hypothetical protein